MLRSQSWAKYTVTLCGMFDMTTKNPICVQSQRRSSSVRKIGFKQKRKMLNDTRKRMKHQETGSVVLLYRHGTYIAHVDIEFFHMQS